MYAQPTPAQRGLSRRKELPLVAEEVRRRTLSYSELAASYPTSTSEAPDRTGDTSELAARASTRTEARSAPLFLDPLLTGEHPAHEKEYPELAGEDSDLGGEHPTSLEEHPDPEFRAPNRTARAGRRMGAAHHPTAEAGDALRRAVKR
jgi:hypothetical protein